MLIEPVFISRREECLPNKLVSIYQKVSPLQTIEEKARSVTAAQPACRSSRSFSTYSWGEAICPISCAHLSLSRHGAAHLLLFERSWLFLQKVSHQWYLGNALPKSPMYFYGPATLGIKPSAVFFLLLHSPRRILIFFFLKSEAITLLPCSAGRMYMARSFPSISANPWEEEI